MKMENDLDDISRGRQSSLCYQSKTTEHSWFLFCIIILSKDNSMLFTLHRSYRETLATMQLPMVIQLLRVYLCGPLLEDHITHYTYTQSTCVSSISPLTQKRRVAYHVGMVPCDIPISELTTSRLTGRAILRRAAYHVGMVCTLPITVVTLKIFIDHCSFCMQNADNYFQCSPWQEAQLLQRDRATLCHWIFC